MSNKEKHYILNLLDNEYFTQWLLCPSDETDAYWHAIMEKDATHKKSILKLRELVKSVKTKETHLSFEDKQLLWEKINGRTIKRKSFRTHYIWYASTAAAAVLLLLLLIPTLTEKPELDYQSMLQSTVQKIENKDICLILPDKKMLSLKEDNVELIYDKSGKIGISAGFALQETNDSQSEDQYNQLLVPYGKTSYVMLSDGTKIWVNSGSRIIYPSVFKPDKREIFVEGEIYIEVAKNERHPFFVKTDLFNVEVTGTSFNVHAYKGEPSQNIVLVSGSVSVANLAKKETIRLSPNQIYDYNIDTRLGHVETVDIYDYICWKYGFFHFRKEQLTTVLERLRKYYNVEITYDKKELEHILVSGKLDLKDNLSETLNSVVLTADVHYSMENHQIVVTKK